MENLTNLNTKMIRRICEMTALATCDMLGINTELTYTRASAEYGQFFRDMVRSGRITPTRVGKGRNGTRWYSAKDIIALRAEEESKARLL